jgi:hypothetical protein
MFRSQCNCNCHKPEQIYTVHLEPCCKPDPTLQLAWEVLEKQFKQNGMDSELIKFAKFCYYTGSSTMLMYFSVISEIQDDKIGMQILDNITKEVSKFMEGHNL